MNEWQIVNIKIVGSSTLSQEELIKQFLTRYKNYDGLIYPLSGHKVVMLIRLGLVSNYGLIKSEIEQKIPDHSCSVMIRKMNAEGLRQIQVDLTPELAPVTVEADYFDLRERRTENKILVADDDRFVRMTMMKALAPYGQVVEAVNGKDAITKYINLNPDILFLDIHMPDKNGLEMLEEILSVDPDAYIIILSADSIKENVLGALEKGANGFLTKPPMKAKIDNYIKQCITLTK
ncbi:MAG: response regulator [Micavibrio sp.]|nr:response regulator [Micavibrio sp.]